MAIAIDATSFSDAVSGTTSTQPHTCSGSNRVLLVFPITAGSTSDVVTSVTYNGVAMTRVDVNPIGTDVVVGYSYYLINPATGTNDIVITTSVSSSIYHRAVSLTGARQTGQPDAHGKGNKNGTVSLDDTLTTIANNAAHFSQYFVNSSASSPGTSTVDVIAGKDFYRYTPLAITPAGSNTVQATWSGTQQVAYVSMSIAPSTTVVNANFLAFM